MKFFVLVTEKSDTVPVTEKDNTKRDGPMVPDDPQKTRMQNCVSYMRTCPMYMPPKPWPDGMFIFGIDHEHRMCCAFFMLTEQFEEIPEDELFGLCNPNTRILYFSPIVHFPRNNLEAQKWITKWTTRPNGEFSATVDYLHVNGWWVAKKRALQS